MKNLQCPNCDNIVINNSKYCVKCGLYLLDNQKFLDSARGMVLSEKQELLGDLYFVISDAVDSDIKKALERIAKKVELIYDKFSNRPYMHEDARLLITKTMNRTLINASELTELQRKKLEHRAQKSTVYDWLGTYQRTLDEINAALDEQGETDIEIDVSTLSPNETVEWYLKSSK